MLSSAFLVASNFLSGVFTVFVEYSKIKVIWELLLLLLLLLHGKKWQENDKRRVKVVSIGVARMQTYNKGGREALLALVAFLVWTVASFLCHKLAKMAVVYFSQHIMDPSPLWAPVIVTLFQVLTCYFTLTFTSRRSRLFTVMAISHTAATLATNTSLTLIFASSALAIKLLEPITSALMQSLVLRAPVKLESLLSLVVIISGAVLFVGDPMQDALFFKGVCMALLSNVVLGIRNTAIKLDHGITAGGGGGGGGGGGYSKSSGGGSGGNASLRDMSHLALYGGGMLSLLGTLFVLERSWMVIPIGCSHFVGLCLASSLCHVLYSFVSTNIILRYMSVVGHAVANIVKRVLVVLLLHFSGRRFATPANWAGLVLCTWGLLLYNGRKILANTTGGGSGGGGQLSPSSASTIGPSHNGGGVLPSTMHDKGGEGNTEASRKTWLLCRVLMVVLGMHLVMVLPDSWWGPSRDYAVDLRHGRLPWIDGHPLLAHNITFQPDAKDPIKVEAFLQQKNLLLLPNDTDQLSPYLTTTQEVVQEAGRVHLNLLSNLLAGKKYAILIGAASFENKGDPAITIGQIRVLERLRIQLVFYINEQKCTDMHYQDALLVAGKYPTNELVILMQGGGNIVGYQGVNYCRMRAMLHFPQHQVVLLSQSVFMRGTQEWLKTMQDAYCCKPRLSILLRDRLSLAIAQRLFPNGTQLLLAPDMAFGIGSVARFTQPFYDVLWLRRYDGEQPEHPYPTSSSSSSSLSSSSLQDAYPQGVSVHVQDWFQAGWDSPKGTTTLETAHNVLQNGLLFLQRGRVVVTERLHGHILATLLDIPHVLLDNADNKLSSYHNTWTRGVANTRLARSQGEALALSLQLLKEYDHSLPPVFPAMHIKA